MYDEDATLFGLGALTIGGAVLDLGLLMVAIPAVAIVSLLLYRLFLGWWT